MHRLAGLFPVRFIRGRPHYRQRLVLPVLRRQRLPMHILDDLDAGLGQALDEIAGLQRLASQRFLLRDDQDAEGRPGLQQLQQALQARPAFELRAGLSVIYEHARVVDRPPLRRGEGVPQDDAEAQYRFGISYENAKASSRTTCRRTCNRGL